MRVSRALAVLTSAALLSAVLAGCSGDGGDGKGAADPAASTTRPAASEAATGTDTEAAGDAPLDVPEETTEAKTTPATKAPSLAVGESGTYEVGETDEYGENFKVTSRMKVTVVSAEYVTPAQVNTTNQPEKGQYVALTLTVRNTGGAPADFAAYGMMKWEDAKTAAQDATTLEGVGEGADLDTTYKPGQSVTGRLVLDVVRRGGVVHYYDANAGGESPSFTVELPK
ncbi:DUF4352 domain-containing protein [Streptomyces buecherae]|uniref:DUF4352 domain-containing protein n=1 Tax=Streptomyces buecherae TaxID=2763006 RepID=A0A7H8N5B6_9ACTN|nr:DUF4352 domain-containing protein [Streptomyces buecherae]QKW49650.1 DUF4352 domain-containing protein [Streptomyces buecherae]